MIGIDVLQFHLLQIQSWKLFLLWYNFLIFFSFDQMSGFSRKILSCSWFFTSIAFFSSFEIIVLTFRAFPASIRELETTSSLLFFAFRWTLILQFVFLLVLLNKSALALWNLLFSFISSLDYVICIVIFNVNVLQFLKLLVNLVHIITLLSNMVLLSSFDDFNLHHFFFGILLHD